MPMVLTNPIILGSRFDKGRQTNTARIVGAVRGDHRLGIPKEYW